MLSYCSWCIYNIWVLVANASLLLLRPFLRLAFFVHRFTMRTRVRLLSDFPIISSRAISRIRASLSSCLPLFYRAVWFILVCIHQNIIVSISVNCGFLLISSSGANCRSFLTVRLSPARFTLTTLFHSAIGLCFIDFLGGLRLGRDRASLITEHASLLLETLHYEGVEVVFDQWVDHVRVLERF